MKNVCFILLTINLIAIPSFAQIETIPWNAVDSVVIKKGISWDALTDAAISCMDFDSGTIYCTTNKKECASICSLFTNLEETDMRAGVDVRAKIYFYANRKEITTACIGAFGSHALIDGFYYKLDSTVRKQLDIYEYKYVNTPHVEKSIYRFDDYPGGRDSINRFINEHTGDIFGNMNTRDTLHINILCRPDKEGNTIFVQCFLRDNHYQHITVPEELQSRVQNVFMKMKWLPNKERQYCDVRWIPILFAPRKEDYKTECP